MPKTRAERQRAWRDRRAGLIATLEADNAQLRADLADALAEAERLACSGRILGRWFDLGLRHRHDRHPCVSRWLIGCW
jgi:hypothetical protein